MKKLVNLHLISINILILIFSQHTSALMAFPTEDLLGPEVCPSGAFCIETDLCTNTYYTTKSGHPFYCGPQQQIDSKVCCVESEHAPTPNPTTIDLNELELNDDHHRSSNLSNDVNEDDEVEILSVPYVSNQIDDDPEAMFSEADAGLDRSLDNLESLLEDAIEQESNSAQVPPSPNVRETGFRPVDTQQSQEYDFEYSNHFNEPTQDIHMGQQFRPANDEENINNEFRTPHNSEKQRTFSCPCERGEKGEPGPKGEPGEPGKIIYIPVFVNTAAPQGSGIPVQFSSSQPSLNQQPGYGQVPQHPNPTVVPFNVPVNIPTNNPPVTQTAAGGILSSSPTPPQQHQQHSVPSPPQQAYQHQVPLSSAQQQQSLPSFAPHSPTNAIPYNDDMQARMSRNTHMNDQRFANRRY